MRILVISDLYPPVAFGGYERQCAALVNGLRERHDVVVLTSNRDLDRAGTEKYVRRDLPYLGPARRQAPLAPLAAIRAAQVTRDVLAHLRPDIVYVANCVGVPQAAPCVAMNAGYRLVFRLAELWYAANLLHGDRFLRHLQAKDRAPRRAWATLMRGINHHPALRLAPEQPVRVAISWCSDDLRERAGTHRYLRPVLERTIYPCSAEGAAAFARLPRRPRDRVIVAYVGRVTVAKGAELACRALAQLRSTHGIDADLLLAGPCTLRMRRRMETLARDLGVAQHLRLLGPLDTAAVGELLQQAHVVVIPSVEHEAFGTVCIEAGLARAPIVASRVGGIPEALRGGEDALLFEPGDAEQCAAALATTICDPSPTERRVHSAFSRMQSFTVERYVKASEMLLEEAAVALPSGEPAPRLTAW